VYLETVPAVLEWKAQNAVMGDRRSELSANCGYGLSGAMTSTYKKSHDSIEADS